MKKVPLIIAHRGASGSAPENTLAAVNKALEIGVDMVEIDVHQTKDKEIVVIHDNTVNRTTNGRGRVRDYSLKHLKALDAGSWFSSEFKNERVPALAEVIKLVKGKAELLIEIKSSGAYPGIEEIIIKILEENDFVKQCVIHCFNSVSLKKIRTHHPEVRIQKLVLGNIFFLPLHIDYRPQLGHYHHYDFVSGINPNHKYINEMMLKKIQQKGQTVYVWTQNDEEKMKELISLGVDGIITDYPEKLKKIIQNLNF